MQIMPSTGAWVAEQIGMTDYKPEFLYDSRVNIQIGTWYLSSLQREFSGDINLVIAAYNGGRGRVNDWLREGIWDGQEKNIYQIPFPETRDFVKKVLFTYQRYNSIY